MPSSVISDFAYDPAVRELTIRFVSGRLYAYSDVPTDVVTAFGDAPSRGTFFNRFIRDHYNYRELPQRSGADR